LDDVVCLAVATGASIVFGAHFPKGDMGIRESIDRIAGSGVFARDPDTVVTMSPQTKPKDYKDETVRFDIDITLRDFPERKPFVVYWDAPLMIVDPTRKPGQNLAGKPGAPVAYPMHEALEVLPPEGLTTTQWMNELKCGKDTMAQIIRDAKNSELIRKISPKSPWIPNIEKIQKQIIDPFVG